MHRIGRTARAGADGTAITFCCFQEKSDLSEVEKFIGEKIPVIENPHYPMEDFSVPVKKVTSQMKKSNQTSKKNNQKQKNQNTQKIIQKQKHSQPKQKKRSFHQNKKTV